MDFEIRGLRSANGFMSHAGDPSPAGGMRLIEIWRVRGGDATSTSPTRLRQR
jgi:hypothetical protein